MIIFEQTLRDLLIKTNLVGTRVSLMRAAQVPAGQLSIPYMVFFPVAPVNAVQLVTHDGPLDVIERDYQISTFDNSQSRGLAIADSLRMYLNTLHGDFENVFIGHAFYMTQTWAWEPDTLLFQIIQEYRIMFRYLNYDPPPVTPNRSKGAKTNEYPNGSPVRDDAAATAARPANETPERPAADRQPPRRRAG
jgi:hypothetical protein